MGRATPALRRFSQQSRLYVRSIRFAARSGKVLAHGRLSISGPRSFTEAPSESASDSGAGSSDTRGSVESRSKYVFSVAAGVLPVSLNISRAGAAGTKRSAPVLWGPRAQQRTQRRESGKSQAPGPADVAAAETAALRIIRGAQRTLNRYSLARARPPLPRGFRPREAYGLRPACRRYRVFEVLRLGRRQAMLVG